ncbi:hypothetical protein GCM10017673_12030 [Streptosporangium violaceochromogenes]|nr:hypothetical protein GCM10017673_12030 [Streptosporangium violaceochromogenes]
MKWTFTSDAEAYAKVVEPWLFRDPVRNTTPITVLRGVRDGLWGDDVLLGLLERDGEVVAAALQTAPLLLLLPDIPVETVPGLAARLVEAGRAIPGVFGPLALAEAFAGAWWRPEIGRRDERLYRLGALAPPPLPVEGPAVRQAPATSCSSRICPTPRPMRFTRRSAIGRSRTISP